METKFTIPRIVTSHLITTLLFIISVLLLPLGFILALTLTVTRALINVYIKFFRPDLISLVKPSDHLYSGDKPHSRSFINIRGYYILRGVMETEKLVERMNQSLDKHSFLQDMSKTFIPFMGFTAWKRVSPFRISDHVTIVSPEQVYAHALKRRKSTDKAEDLHNVSETEVLQFMDHMAYRPFAPGNALWESIMCPGIRIKGVIEPCTLLIFRMHHALGDAISFFKAISSQVDNPQVLASSMEKIKRSVQKSIPEPNFVRRLLFPVLFLPLGIYQAWFMVVDSYDFNEWHRPTTPIDIDFNYAMVKVDLETLKNLRKVYGDVSLFSILTTAQTVAIKRFMRRVGVPVPETMHNTFTVSAPDDEAKLTNAFALMNSVLPTGMNNRKKITRVIHKEHWQRKRSFVQLFNLTCIRYFMGLLPRPIIKMIRFTMTTCLLTNLPAGDAPLTILNHKILYAGATGSVMTNAGFHVWCSSYCGTLTMTVGICQHITKKVEQVKEFENILKEEFQHLLNQRLIIED